MPRQTKAEYESRPRVGPRAPSQEPARRRAYVLMKKYGITPQDFDSMYSAQGGQCAICQRPFLPSDLHVDHDHLTNEVRGLLCHKCNVGLGHYGDSVTLLGRAITYLTKKDSHVA